MKNRPESYRNSVLLFTIICMIVGIVAGTGTNAAAEAQAAKYEGYLADVLCATRGTALDGADMMKHPEKHSVGCLKESPCVASGFGVLVKGKDDTYAFSKFDKKGNELALELINKTKKKDNFTVEVTGSLKDGVFNVSSIVEK